MKYDVKDLNAPSRWNMRIWDDDNDEWLCQSDKNASTYYGFDITGGEITEFQGLPKWHAGRHLIWEQSTGLKDKKGKEIYEGDILQDIEGDIAIVFWRAPQADWGIRWCENKAEGSLISQMLWGGLKDVIGNIHETPGLLVEVNDVD